MNIGLTHPAEANLKKIARFLSPASQKRNPPRQPVKLFFTLFKLNVTFLFQMLPSP